MKQGKVREARHKPNVGLYLRMLFGAMAILLILFFIPQSSVFFSIISGVGSGCVASVIVAWLIEKSNCDKYNDRDDDIKEHYYRNIEDSMDSLFEEIARLVHEKQPKEISIQRNSGKWFEWVADIQRNKEFRFNVEELECVSKCIIAQIMQEVCECRPNGRRRGSARQACQSAWRHGGTP